MFTIYTVSVIKVAVERDYIYRGLAGPIVAFIMYTSLITLILRNIC